MWREGNTSSASIPKVSMMWPIPHDNQYWEHGFSMQYNVQKVIGTKMKHVNLRWVYIRVRVQETFGSNAPFTFKLKMALKLEEWFLQVVGVFIWVKTTKI